MTTTNNGNNDTRYFDHERLDAFHVALDAMVLGDAIGRGLPRGYGNLSDQLRRALSGAYLQTSEGAARLGADRANRFRVARAEAGEAAAALTGLVRLGVVDAAKAEPVMQLLRRLAAMLGKLGGR